jgi:tRNA (guanine37-N1)-methyltransferase
MRPNKIKIPEIASTVQGMTKLNRDLFSHKTTHFSAVFPRTTFNKIPKPLKKQLDKHKLLKTRKVTFTDKENMVIPVSFSPTSNEIKQFSEKCPEMSFVFKEVEYTYNSFNVNEILSTVLPENLPAVTNFAQIGHICHLNLRKVHEPYEELIGEVILDKVNNCRTVVVKEKAIENEFRTLPLKIIAGEKTATSMICEHREHGCVFSMNFETVYWNSRLQEEHHNVSQFIIDRCQNDEDGKRTHVIDACCGIGPFVIPIAKAKKKVVKNRNIGHIFANDLNPESMSLIFHLLCTSIVGKSRPVVRA